MSHRPDLHRVARHHLVKKFTTDVTREHVLWAKAELEVEKFVRLYTAVTALYRDDPLRRLGCVSNLLNDLTINLKPYADELRKDWNCGPNQWQTHLVKTLFDAGGTTEDRAWWGRTFTSWWEQWRTDEERDRYGF